MKPLPESTKELKLEALQLGLMMPNPKLDTPRKQLISYVWSSHSIGRSISQASILFVGTSGVGKSSTINHLFNLEDGITFAKISDVKSETRVTTEYKLQSDYPRFGAKNLSLGLVDSPGFNDTDGTKQDACNFYSIKRFYEEHPKLSGCYPNLIFLLVQATDTRISGPNSNLSKSLKFLSKLDLVDRKHPNVVGVLTWSCAIPRKEWEKKIDGKKKRLKDTIFQFLNITAPIVAVENEAEDNGLEKVGDYSRLPDGVLQPKNLYDACSALLYKSNDKLGHVILNACFLKAKELGKPVLGFHVEAKNASKRCLSHEEERFFKMYEKTAQGGIEDPIIREAQDFIEKEKLSQEVSNEIQMLVGEMKSFGIQDKEDFKYIRAGCLSSGGPLSESAKKYLEQLQIKSSPVAINSSRVIGQGYNVRNDKVVPSQIFEIETIDSGYGVLVPTIAKFEKLTQSRDYMNEFEDHVSMTKSRMSQLNIGLDVDYNQFEFKVRAGATTKVSLTNESHLNEASFLHEERIFELKMANFQDERLKFTADFKSAVAKLPNTYNVEDRENRGLYERFFERWGHFIVVSAYGGGSIEAKVSSEENSSKHATFQQKKMSLVAAFNSGTIKAKLTLDNTDEKTQKVTTKNVLTETTFAWVGGDRNLHSKVTIEDPKAMDKWKLSLMANPTILETEMYLEPISTVVGCVDGQKDSLVFSALKGSLGGDFKVIKSEEDKAKANAKAKMTEATTRADTVVDPEPGIKCFPSSAKVTILEGNESIEKIMSDVQIGDLVLIRKMKSKRTIFSPVIMFAHSNASATAEYLQITLENGKHITLSGNHLLMVGREEKMIMAEEVKNGDLLFMEDEMTSEVVEIKEIVSKGVFCPITDGGTIFVNNILASCYASVDDYAFFNGAYKMTGHELAHCGLLPMRIWYKISTKKESNRQTKVKNKPVSEMHPYIRWLCKIHLPWMAKN